MFRLIVPVLGAALYVFPVTAEAATRIGRVVAVVGVPGVSGPTGARSLKADAEVFEEDKITVKTGNVQLELVDGTRIVVGPDSTLELAQFVKRDGQNLAERVSLKALRGTYRFITGKSPKSAYVITTAHATIGIRGTAFDVWSRRKTGAVVLQGAVQLSGLNAGAVEVTAGCNMGAASADEANLLVGSEKNESIRENLPFLTDQASLQTEFQLDVSACGL